MLELRADIELPAPPSFPWMDTLTILVVLMVAFAVIALLRSMIDRPAGRGTPIRRLKQPLDTIQTEAADAKEQAYRLAALLKSHFGLAQLDATQPPQTVTNRDDWANLVRQLTAQRYQMTTSGKLPAEMFIQIQRWLHPTGKEQDSV